MKANPRIIIVGLVVSGILAGGWAIERARAQRISQLSGFFESTPVTISARTAGRVHRLMVTEGDTVRPGEILVRLESGPDQARLDSLEAEVKSADSKLAAARLRQDEDMVRRKQAVREARAELAIKVEGSREAEIEAAAAKVRELEAALREAVTGPRKEDIDAARAALRSSTARLQSLQNGGTPATRARLEANLASAVAAEDEAQKQQVRIGRLVEAGAFARAKLDSADAEYLRARASRKAAEAALAELVTRPEEIAEAQAEVDRNRSQLRLLENGTRAEDLAAAKARLEEAKANLQLLREGNRPEEIESAAARLRQAEVDLQSTVAGSASRDVEQARLALQTAEENAKAERLRTQESQLPSPRSGVVERIPVAEGDLVSAGQTLMRLTDPTNLYLRVFVPERALAKIKVGHEVRIRVDGLRDEVLGKVATIANQGEFTPANLQTPEERGKQVFGVRIHLVDSKLPVKVGMAATVTRIGQWEPGQ